MKLKAFIICCLAIFGCASAAPNSNDTTASNETKTPPLTKERLEDAQRRLVEMLRETLEHMMETVHLYNSSLLDAQISGFAVPDPIPSSMLEDAHKLAKRSPDPGAVNTIQAKNTTGNDTKAMLQQVNHMVEMIGFFNHTINDIAKAINLKGHEDVKKSIKESDIFSRVKRQALQMSPATGDGARNSTKNASTALNATSYSVSPKNTTGNNSSASPLFPDPFLSPLNPKNQTTASSKSTTESPRDAAAASAAIERNRENAEFQQNVVQLMRDNLKQMVDIVSLFNNTVHQLDQMRTKNGTNSSAAGVVLNREKRSSLKEMADMDHKDFEKSLEPMLKGDGLDKAIADAMGMGSSGQLGGSVGGDGNVLLFPEEREYENIKRGYMDALRAAHIPVAEDVLKTNEELMRDAQKPSTPAAPKMPAFQMLPGMPGMPGMPPIPHMPQMPPQPMMVPGVAPGMPAGAPGAQQLTAAGVPPSAWPNAVNNVVAEVPTTTTTTTTTTTKKPKKKTTTTPAPESEEESEESTEKVLVEEEMESGSSERKIKKLASKQKDKRDSEEQKTEPTGKPKDSRPYSERRLDTWSKRDQNKKESKKPEVSPTTTSQRKKFRLREKSDRHDRKKRFIMNAVRKMLERQNSLGKNELSNGKSKS